MPPETIGQLANRLGNQFVIERGTELPEDPFERALTTAATGRPTPMDVSTWSPDEIKHRQEMLSQLAPGVWPLLPD